MTHRLSWWKKFASSFGVLAFFGFLFLFPHPASAEQCHGKIGEPPLDKKYAIFYWTSSDASDANGNPLNGKECYVLVNNSQSFASYNDMLSEEVFANNWANSVVSIEVFAPNTGTYVPDNAGGLGAALSTVNFPFQKVGHYVDERKDYRQRYVIRIGGNKFYFYFMRVEFASEAAREKQIECRNKMIAQDARCNPPELPSIGDGMDAFTNFISASNNYPAECKTFFDTCIQNELKALGGTSPTSTSKFDQYLNDPKYQPPKGYNGPLPACAFSFQGCRNVNDLLQLLINIGKIAFSFIGTAAFLMFIYGGFTIILSTGNAEQVKKGKGILIAAVTGMIIAFGAYLLIDFVLNALQVGSDFRAIK